MFGIAPKQKVTEFIHFYDFQTVSLHPNFQQVLQLDEVQAHFHQQH